MGATGPPVRYHEGHRRQTILGCGVRRANVAMAYESTKSKKTPCPKCGNPLRLFADQLGEEVRCPKCNATFTVGGSKRPASTSASEATADASDDSSTSTPTEPVVSDDDAYEPETPLDRWQPVPEDQMSDIGPHAGIPSEYEVDWESADVLEMEAPVERPPVNTELYEESARRRGILRDDETPEPPRWTFFSGVFNYPWRGANLSRWAAMSFGLSIAGVVDYQAIETAGLLNDDLTQATAFGIIQIVFGVMISLAVLAFAAASCRAAIIDTADGHDLPQDDTLPEWDQWIFTLVAWASLGAASASVGYPLTLAIGPAGFFVTLVILFPVLLLSAMEADSYIMPVSAPVLRTLLSYARGWLAFYVLSSAMLVAVAAGFVVGLTEAPLATCIVMGPVLAAVMLIYSRLLGRLAWGASGGRTPPTRKQIKKAQREAADTALAKSKQRKKRKGKRIVVPEPIEPGDDSAGESPAGKEPTDERPRISFHHRP